MQLRLTTLPLLLPCRSPPLGQVLMSGLEGEQAAHLTRRFSAAGVPSERVMVCEY